MGVETLFLEDKIFSVAETAVILKVKECAIRAWIHQKRLPTINLGSRKFVKKETLESILNGGLEAVAPFDITKSKSSGQSK